MKFKNIKKKTDENKPGPKSKKEAKKPESPKNHRSITEHHEKKSPSHHQGRKIVWWVYVVCILSVIGLVLVGIGMGRYMQQRKVIELQHEALADKLVSWERVIQKYPDYRDAYMEAAVFAYELKDMKKALGYVEKVLELDPNFEPGLRLKGILITQER